MPWAAPRGRFTLSFEANVIALLQQCRTVRGRARLARITEDAADGVMRRAVERGLLRRQLQPPTLLGLDEKAIRTGHRYATFLTDVENGYVIDLVEERTTQGIKCAVGNTGSPVPSGTSSCPAQIPLAAVA